MVNISDFFCYILLESKSVFNNNEIEGLKNVLLDKREYNIMDNSNATLILYSIIKRLGYAGVKPSVINKTTLNENLLLLCFITQRLGIKLTENDSAILDSSDELMQKIKLLY